MPWEAVIKSRKESSCELNIRQKDLINLISHPLLNRIYENKHMKNCMMDIYLYNV